METRSGARRDGCITGDPGKGAVLGVIGPGVTGDATIISRRGHCRVGRDTGLIEIDGEEHLFSHPVMLDFVRRELSVEEVKYLS